MAAALPEHLAERLNRPTVASAAGDCRDGRLDEPVGKAGAAERFAAEFRDQRAAIERSLEELRGAASGLARGESDARLHDAVLQIAALDKRVIAAMSFMPAYDARQCQTQLQQLRELTATTRAAVAPSGRFKFRGRAAATTAAAASVAQPPALPPGNVAQSPAVPVANVAQSQDRDAERLIRVERLCDESTSVHVRNVKDMNIAHVERSVVHVSAGVDLEVVGSEGLPAELEPVVSHECAIAALHVCDVRDSVLVLSVPVRGSVMLERCINTVVIVACRQFRMHHSTGSTVALICSTPPIIEDCSDLRFAPYPILLRTQPEAPLPPLLAVTRDLLAQSSLLCAADAADPAASAALTNYGRVQDFNWIKPTASPHWRVASILEEEDLQEAFLRHVQLV